MRGHNNSNNHQSHLSDGKRSNQKQCQQQQPRQPKGLVGLFPRSRSVENAPHSPSGNRSMVSSAYEARRNPHSIAEVANDFVPNPKVATPPASPSSTPPKKVWEHHMKNFLTRRKPSDSPGSGHSTPPTPDSSATASPTGNGTLHGINTKKPFSLIPGTKRLLVRNSPQQVHRTTKSVNDLDVVRPRSSSPSSPSNLSALLNPTVKNNGLLSSNSDEKYQGIQQHGERSIHGGKHFQSVFGRSSSDSMFQHQIAAGESVPELPTASIQARSTSSGSILDRARRHQSMDELDDTLRKGVEKSYSPDSPLYNPMIRKTYAFVQTATDSLPTLPNGQIPTTLREQQYQQHSHQQPAIPCRSAGGDSDENCVQRKPLNENDENESLDALLASASTRTASASHIFSSSGQQQVAAPLSALSSSSSWGHYTFHQHQLQYDDALGSGSRHDQAASSHAQTPAPTTATQAGSQLGLLMASYPYREHAASNAHYANGAEAFSEQAYSERGYSHSMMQNPSSIPGTLQPDSSTTTDQELKKAFTVFHNGASYAQDSTSPFLGEEPPSSTFYLGHDSASYMTSYALQFQNYHQHHPSAALMQMMMMQSAGAYGGGSSVPYHAISERNFRPSVNVSTSLPLEAVDELNISVHRSLRLLKPIESTDTWQTGRRYLISPAVLAACPLSVVKTLSGSQRPLTAQEAASDKCGEIDVSCFRTIDLGDALTTYVGENHHLSLGKWSSCRLVLRQNYLLEYDSTASIQGLPRGFAHLEHAVAYPHDDFPDALELQFFASPCAKSDKRVLMIRVKNREDRDHWITCLNDAAQMRISDLYDYDERFDFGKGRYASVYPARRRTKLYYNSVEPLVAEGEIPDKLALLERCDCALKVVDKNQFWRRVVKGRERADTLVRELSVQATLTSKHGRTTPTFLQIRGLFETSDKVVMELELLEGTDLFDYVSSKGVLAEEEAASIMRDVLKSLDAMNRAGLAHRDIKPANVLMCNKARDGVTARVGDFGMSTFVGVDGLVRGRCGTPGYVAPEILTAGCKVGYGNKVDVFSAGITMYVMLCGYEPFYGESEKELIEANKAAVIEFPESDWSNVSEEARDLVLRTTRPDPEERLSAKEALQHPWILKHNVDEIDAAEDSSHAFEIAEVGACVIS